MAASIYDWSLTAASNSNADSDIAWPEGQAPSTVNNSARAMMQRVKELLVDLGGSLAASGTANGLIVTAESAYSAYADGQVVAFRATASNTGAATLSVNGIGAKSIRKFDAGGEVALVAGDIRNTGIYVVRYSVALNAAAGAWLLINPTFVGKAMTMQQITVTGTWTNPGCRYVIVDGCGAGAGGGGVANAGLNTAAAAGGGSSGAFGRTGIIDVIAVTSGAAVIGAAGTAGASGGGNGGNGGLTSIVLGATTYTWAGGGGGFGNVASGVVFNLSSDVGCTTGSANVLISSGWGLNGFCSVHSGAGFLVALGGAGGSSPYAQGGASSYCTTTSGGSVSVAGNAPLGGYGGGGGGASVVGAGTNRAGGAGVAGILRVWEIY